MLMRGRNGLVTMIAGMLLFWFQAGCASYSPMPISAQAVRNKLRPPDMTAIKSRLGRIRHATLPQIPFNYADGLSPDEAAILAVVLNPSLRAARDATKIGAAQVLEAGILPNPEVSVSFEAPVGGETSDKVSGFGLGMSWTVTSLLARSAKIAATRSALKSIDLGIAWKEWQVAEAAKLQTFRVLLDEQIVEYLNASVRAAEESWRVTSKAVTQGIETVDTLADAQATLDHRRADLLSAKACLSRDRLELKRILGLPSKFCLRLQEHLDPLSVIAGHVPSREDLIGQISRTRLDLVAFRLGYESQEERLRAAILSQFPKIKIGLLGGRDTDAAYTMGVGVSISLPVFGSAGARVKREEATRQQLFDEYIARLFEAKSQVYQISTQLRWTVKQIAQMQQSERKLIMHLAQLRKAAQARTVPIGVYYQALQELWSKKLQIVRLEQTMIALAIALELQSGRYIFTSIKNSRKVNAPDEH